MEKNTTENSTTNGNSENCFIGTDEQLGVPNTMKGIKLLVKRFKKLCPVPIILDVNLDKVKLPKKCPFPSSLTKNGES